MRGAAMTKTGPNNTSGIVWAISEFFFSFFIFLKPTDIYSIYIMVVYETHNRRGGGNKNRPKQCQMCFWAISEFFFSFLLFWILTKVYSIYNGNLQNT